MVFSDEIQKNVTEIVRELRAKYKSYTLVGFHVRKGDITQNGNIALGYKSAGPGYINRSLEYFHSRFPDSVFVVSSDWNRGITLYMDDFVVPGSPIGDQYNKTDYIYPGWVGL
nr:hypothetical protein BaRGS_006307 [Batillaria attramentaria]KAG5705724.1 hypothetical protein BaRGS_027383 [Batillaria attramentaria]